MRDPSRSTVLTVIVCGVVFVLGYLLGAANTRRSFTRGAMVSATPAGGPRLQVQEAEHDFGTVAHDGTLQHAFRVTNPGNSDLVIGNIEAACGCTVASMSTAVVPSRGTAEINVTFNAKDQHGQVDKEIEVESNDPTSPVTTLHLKGRVLEAGEATPAAR